MTMCAILKPKAAPGLRMDEVPIPQIGERDVLIRVLKTSICGTDAHIYKWDAWAQQTLSPPLIIGHEFMGRVAKIGSRVKEIQVGMRVSGEGHITCGHCPQCHEGLRHLCPNTQGIGVQRSGCFAEYIALPEENVFILPDSISDDDAAIFDPFGNAVHTALSCELVAQDVLITGAGPIGCMAAAVARKAGARHVVITDLSLYRLELARHMGATEQVDVSKESVANVAKRLGIDHGFDVGLEMSGHPTGLQTLIDQMHSGGKIALLGILPPECCIDWNLIIFKMLHIQGISGRQVFRTWHQMIHLLESGLDLSPIITHHLPAKQFEEGFAAMMSGQSGKIILDWSSAC